MTVHSRKMTVTAAVVALVSLFAAGGCTSPGGHVNVQTVAPDTAQQTVRRYADETLAAIGTAAHWGPGNGLPNVNPEPCDGQGADVYRMLGIYSVIIPAGQALDTLHRLRDHWKQLGYTITEERYFASPPSGDLTARNPADSFELGLAAAAVEHAFVLNVSSPCYRSATPLN